MQLVSEDARPVDTGYGASELVYRGLTDASQ